MMNSGRILWCGVMGQDSCLYMLSRSLAGIYREVNECYTARPPSAQEDVTVRGITMTTSLVESYRHKQIAAGRKSLPDLDT